MKHLYAESKYRNEKGIWQSVDNNIFLVVYIMFKMHNNKNEFYKEIVKKKIIISHSGVY